jgi:hypothetical protein
MPGDLGSFQVSTEEKSLLFTGSLGSLVATLELWVVLTGNGTGMMEAPISEVKHTDGRGSSATGAQRGQKFHFSARGPAIPCNAALRNARGTAQHLVLAYVHTVAYGLMPSFYRLISGGFLGLQSVTIFLRYYSMREIQRCTV